MAIIGLYDVDMNSYLHVPFNLELMKLATYYKSKRQIVALTPMFTPERYTKLIARKDYNDGIFPKELFDPKVEFGGLATTNNQYVPLDLDIERLPADTYIYTRMKPLFCTGRTYENVWSAMERATHLRLSLDGIHIYEPSLKHLYTTQNYFFHDVDLNTVEGAREVINDIALKQNTYHIGTKFPIQLHNFDDILKWCSLPIMGYNFCIEYNGIMSDEEFCAFLKVSQGTSMSMQINYNVTSGFQTEQEFLTQGIIHLFNQLTFCRNKLQKISLKYESNFFSDERWCMLLDLFNAYANSIPTNAAKDQALKYVVIECDTLYSYVANLSPWINQQLCHFDLVKLRELFYFVRQENYELFQKFYEQSKVALKGGYLCNVTTRDSRLY